MPTQCPQCGYFVTKGSILCPNCGASLPKSAAHGPAAAQSSESRITPPATVSSSVVPEPDAPAPPEISQPVKRQRKSRRGVLMTILVILLAIVLLGAALAGGAYAGIYQGERDRQAQRQAVIDEHYNAGIQALNEGRSERAAAEFAYVLELSPGHALAEQGLAEARARVEIKPTPTLEVVISMAEQLLAQAKASYQAEEWVATARTLTQLRALDSAYEQQSVEDMLFTSLYNAGAQFLTEDRLEEGISYLDQAIALRPLDADVVRQRNLAARYLDALNYWAVDWDLCIDRFAALYATDPLYKDVAQRLYRAHVAYADYFAEVGEMCPAEVQYSEALRMVVDGAVEQQRANAASICLVATPVPISGTVSLLTPQPIAGFNVGRLAYSVYNSGTGVYDLYALYAEGRIIHVASNSDQPWWEQGTGRVAYRNLSLNGISMELPEEGVPLQLLSQAGQSWPALSPDSQRIAYSQIDADGSWGVYIVDTLGQTEPKRLGRGMAPAWGRSGLIAYTGCDDQACGIITDNPDDDAPGRRLTGSENDLAVAWAPGGNLMAYMSNVTGSWDLYLLSPEGGVQVLLSEAYDEGLPAWSPDGSAIAYVSNRDGGWGVYVKPLGDQMPRRILDLGAQLPSWQYLRLSWAP